MSGFSELERFLSPDPIDPGCEEVLRLMDVYVELLLAGEEPERRYPDLAAHLRACPPCAQDFEGLLEAVGRSYLDSR